MRIEYKNKHHIIFIPKIKCDHESRSDLLALVPKSQNIKVFKYLGLIILHYGYETINQI